MRFEFKLPDIGEGMVEGEIVKWHTKVGNSLAEDAPMLDVMTDKATVTISAPKAGKVLEIHAKEGEIKKVGSVLIVLDTLETRSEGAPSKAPLQLEKQSAPAESVIRREPLTVPVATASGGNQALATPATRRLAHELGIDLSRVVGSGPGGRVMPEDVRKSLDKAPSKEVRVAPPSGDSGSPRIRVPVSSVGAGEERIPFRGLRRKIADKMLTSKNKIPHFTFVEEADVTELVALRDKVDSLHIFKGVRLTYLPFIIKATIVALKKHPKLNSVLDEEKQELVIKHEYNIGIAAATPEGLTVPVIKGADQKTILEIAQEIQEVAEKARGGKFSVEDLQGSTFTITSLGPLGGIFATPIINYPEVAILGVHRIQKRPVARENQVIIRDMMYVSLSFDHRVIDGDVGARFAYDVIEYLQHPGLLMLE